MGLSLDHSLKCRRLIESEWYQRNWGHVFKLSKKQNTKSYFENDKLGYRISTAVGAGSLGFGGGIRLLDDPNNILESELVRKGNNEWYKQIWQTRSNNAKSDVLIINQQRYDPEDITGFVLNQSNGHEWTRLVLPMEFEEERKSQVFIRGELFWEDPRTKEGELLCPNRLNRKQVDDLKASYSSATWAGQFQQRPMPAEGGTIKREYFRIWNKNALPNFQLVIQSWDTALEAKDANCFSACTTWGLFNNEYGIPHLMLIGVWRGRLEYPELRKKAIDLYKDYRNDGSVVIIPDGQHKPDRILIEAKASGIPLVQEFIKAGIPASRFDPTPYGDKEQRVKINTHLLECGLVYVQGRAPDYKEPTEKAALLIEECVLFPKGHRDLVDTMTQVLIRLKENGLIAHPTQDLTPDDMTITMKLYDN